jgi:hypothetical protein
VKNCVKNSVMMRINPMSKRLLKSFLASRLLLLVFLLATLPMLPAVGFAEEPPMQWNTLTPEQQQVLQRFESQWGTFPEERKKRLLAGAERWLQATPQQRDTMKQRFSTWKNLPEDKKQLLRNKFQEFKSLSPEEQARIRKRYQWYKDLSPDKKQQLRERWNNMTPEQKHKAKQRIRQRYKNLSPQQKRALQRRRQAR